MQVLKKDAEASTESKRTPLEIYKIKCEEEYKDLSELFDKAEQEIEIAWGGGTRPEYPWKIVNDRKFVAMGLDNKELKIPNKGDSLNGYYKPSDYYHFAYVDYKYAMLNLTSKNFTGKEYNEAKDKVRMGRKELEKFRQAYEVFPNVIDAN